MGVSDDKASMRAAILEARRRRTPEMRRQVAEAIAAHLLAAPFARVKRVAVYLSMASEPGTDPLIDGFLDRGTEVIVPILGQGRTLRWVPLDREGPFVTSELGIPEPAEAQDSLPLTTAGLIIVPALAVDHQGWRIGRGAGYFDRALASVAVPACALVHVDELVENVPHEPHDVGVQLVATEAGIFRVP